VRTLTLDADRAGVNGNVQEVLKWNGWGYRNCGFEINKDGVIVFQGER
jgi:hypothetical protein